MKKLLIVLVFTGSLFAACGSNSEESDKKDSINAARSADSMLQNELNADTSMNTGNSMDNMPTDSMTNSNSK